MSTATSTTSQSYAVDLVGWLAAWNDHDADGVITYYTDDVEYQDPATDGALHGKDALRSHLKAMWKAFPDLTFEARTLIAKPDGFAAEWYASCTHAEEFAGLPGTGKRFEKRVGVDVCQVRDGKIAIDRAYFDLAVLAE